MLLVHPSCLASRKIVALGAMTALAALVACSEPPPAKAEPKIDAGVTNPADSPPNPEVRKALFAEFQPVALSNCQFERIGGKSDGGYLACGNLLASARAGYSYGIAHTDDWGCQVSARLKAPVHQYDCFDTKVPVCRGGTTVFHAECVGPTKFTEEGRLFDTVQAQIAKNGDNGKRLIVKMDVEGAEWASLLATPDAVLTDIDQLVLEFHHVDQPLNVDSIRKLRRFFHLVNIHYNNHACAPNVAPFPAWAFQVLLVNKKVGVLAPAGTIARVPNPLDEPDDPSQPDCQAEPAVTESKSTR